MSKKKFRCILDTETANGLERPLPYDFSYIICEGKELREVRRRAFVIREIFFDTALMDSAYYAEKVPLYWEAIWSGKKKLVSAYEARKIFFEDLTEFHCRECYAYNMAFDRRALNNLISHTSNGKYNWFWKKGIKLYCIWHMATESFLASRKYYEVAISNGWVSPKGNLLTNAECAYRFLSGDYDFKEKHQGIDDSEIESVILRHCLSLHKKLDKTPSSACWRSAQKVMKKERDKAEAKKAVILAKIEKLKAEIADLETAYSEL